MSSATDHMMSDEHTLVQFELHGLQFNYAHTHTHNNSELQWSRHALAEVSFCLSRPASELKGPRRALSVREKVQVIPQFVFKHYSHSILVSLFKTQTKLRIENKTQGIRLSSCQRLQSQGVLHTSLLESQGVQHLFC